MQQTWALILCFSCSCGKSRKCFGFLVVVVKTIQNCYSVQGHILIDIFDIEFHGTKISNEGRFAWVNFRCDWPHSSNVFNFLCQSIGWLVYSILIEIRNQIFVRDCWSILNRNFFCFLRFHSFYSSHIAKYKIIWKIFWNPPFSRRHSLFLWILFELKVPS